MKENKNFQKTIYVLTAIFYLLTSQIYPYIHLHSHDHNGEVQFEICTTQTSSQLATHQCCEAHQNEHQHFLSDRQYISKKNLQNIDSDSDLITQSTLQFEADGEYHLAENYKFCPASLYLSANYNKAPPAAA